MIVAVLAVLAMHVTVDDVIDVAHVRDRDVFAADAVFVIDRMRVARVVGIAASQVVFSKLVFVDVIAVRMVEMPVVNVIHVVLMADGQMAAFGAVKVVVAIVNVRFHGANLEGTSKCTTVADSGSTRGARTLGRASGTGAVKGQFVSARLETARQLGAHARTAFEFVDAVALRAREVMVVPLARYLVERATTGNLDDGQPAVVEQRANRPIHGRHAEPSARTRRFAVNFFRRERPTGALEGVPNRLLLPRVAHVARSFHTRQFEAARRQPSRSAAPAI